MKYKFQQEIEKEHPKFRCFTKNRGTIYGRQKCQRVLSPHKSKAVSKRKSVSAIRGEREEGEASASTYNIFPRISHSIRAWKNVVGVHKCSCKLSLR